MNNIMIDLGQYEGKDYAHDSQEERITFLIQKLREYKKLPAREMKKIMPALWEVEQKCKLYNVNHDIPAMNYIIEILKALEAEYFADNTRNDFIFSKTSEELI